MKNFIEISDTQESERFLVNINHIVYLKTEDVRATLLLTNNVKIKTENNYKEIKEFIEAAISPQD